MARPLTVRKPTGREVRRLNRLVEEAETPRQRRKAHVLVLHAEGMNARDIAQALGVHPNTVYADLEAFAQQGLASLQSASRRGAPTRLQPAHAEAIWRLAQTPPSEVGLPYGRWSLATLRSYLIQHRLLPSISREYLRQVLKKGASTSGASSPSCFASTLSEGRSWPGCGPSGSTCRRGGGSCSSMSSPLR